MFKDSNIIIFLMCIIPVVFYSIAIFMNSPTFSIRFKSSFTYLYTGLLSVTLLQFIHFIFPHISDSFFTEYIGNFSLKEEKFVIIQPTLATLLTYAFVQVALMEEFSKWIAFQFANYMRGNRRKNLDHPYAMMFYSSLISAAFAIAENIQYAQRAMSGEFGAAETAESVLAIRAISSVIVHMACGLFMGYYIALAKKSSITKKIIYNIIGIGVATFMHGIYDFSIMRPGADKDFYDFFGLIEIPLPTFSIIAFCLTVAFIMSFHLKKMIHKEAIH